jgi:hypothetical protein
MFIAALFTIAKLWKEPRCPTTDKWIEKMWYLFIISKDDLISMLPYSSFFLFCFIYLFFILIYSYVHTLFGPFLPPAPQPLPLENVVFIIHNGILLSLKEE